MTLRIENTTAADVNQAIAAERRRLGATATGMVLTLCIVTDEQSQSEATRAAAFSAGQHPCRILVIIPRPGRGKPRLDADVIVGDQNGPGETVKLRLHGPLAAQQASVVLPLLLPDTPVVAWWPNNPPPVPQDDEIGRLAQRRVTDAATAKRPLSELTARAASYEPGDTDLAWTRLTPWRSMLATALDLPFDEITGAQVSAQRGNPSAPLLVGWLRSRLNVPVELKNTRGPGITGITVQTVRGNITLSRPDGHMAILKMPKSSPRKLPLHRRQLRDLITEELRLLDADEMYEHALNNLSQLPLEHPNTKSKPKRSIRRKKEPK